MQQMTSQEQSEPNEIATLGESHHLGSPEGAFYVMYTQEDIRRNRIFHLFISFFALYMLIMLIEITVLIVYWHSMHMYYLSFMPFLSFLYLPILLYFNATQRKWGNRPIINAENLHQRVYIYQDGCIKKTNRHCEIVRWPEIFKTTYIPLQTPNAQEEKIQTSNTARNEAGITIMRHGGLKLKLSGALADIDDLARLLHHHINVTQAYSDTSSA